MTRDEFRDRVQGIYRQLSEAGEKSGAVAICRRWHGSTFGTSGHGSPEWNAGEIARAEEAIQALDEFRKRGARESQEKKP